MRVSVVVCTRNGEAFLREQLTSILRQTYPPSEIIISDDGSTDSSPSIIREFREAAQKAGIACQIFANDPPLGVTRNFESACQSSNGDVIFLADQDDVWHAGKIAQTLAVLADKDVVLVSSNAEIIDASGKKLGETLFERLHITGAELALLKAGELAHLILYRTAFTGATLAFKRVVLTHAIPFNSDIVHDEWLVHVAWLIGDVRTVPEAIMDYRLHASNTIGLDPPPVAEIDATRSGRLRLHFARVIDKLAAVIEHFSEKTYAAVIVERLELRRLQLALAITRKNYPPNVSARARAVVRTWVSGLYRVEQSPARTACLDIFRSANMKQTK